MRRNFMTSRIQVLDVAIVCPLMGYVESGCYGAAIGVCSSVFKQICIQSLVEIIC